MSPRSKLAIVAILAPSAWGVAGGLLLAARAGIIHLAALIGAA